MNTHDEWIPFTWHCSSCGSPVVGYKNSKGTIKVECNVCHLVMVRTIRNRRHDTIELYAPKGQENCDLISY